MLIPIDTSKWHDNLWAALISFTRLPLRKVYEPPSGSFAHIYEYWPLTGWLTGCTMAAVLWIGSTALPYPVAVIIAMAARMLLTGASNEDSLRRFIDGFTGGGNDSGRILAIMKGTGKGIYGIIGTAVYEVLLFVSLLLMPPDVAALTVATADPYARMIASQIILMMPQAGTGCGQEHGTAYRRMGTRASAMLAVQGLLPPAAYIYIMYARADWQMMLFAPCAVMYLLYLLIWNRLRGYTAECCGALFLLVELAVYASAMYAYI